MRFRNNFDLIKEFSNQTSNKGSRGNLHFQGNLLYSYNQCICKIKHGYAFLIDYNYSNTTARHINITIECTKHLTQVFVQDLGLFSSSREIAYKYEKIAKLKKKRAKARKPELYDRQIAEQRKNIQALLEYQSKWE